MKTSIKRRMVQRVIAAVIVALMGIPVASTAVAAGNWGDTPFNYHWGYFDGTKRTEVRAKLDTTSSYMKATYVSGGNSYNAYVTAAVWDGKQYQYIDVRCGTYKFMQGTTLYLCNWVRERGFTAASIAATPGNVLGLDASGWWSPDSI